MINQKYMEKIYIVTSEYTQNGYFHNKAHRNFKDPQKALQFFEESVKTMTDEHKDMVESPMYRTKKGGSKYGKFYYCYFNLNPEVSSFSVSMSQENVE